MKFDKILTKDVLYDNLVNQKKALSVFSEEIGCSKQTMIKYCKKHGIYGDIECVRSIATGRSQDLTGKQFGKLTVLEKGPNDSFHKVRWNCECTCGRTKLVNAASLTRGLTKSCGYCDRVNFKGYKDVSGVYTKRLRENAHKRGMEFEITAEDIYNKLKGQNYTCALSGVDIFFCPNQDRAVQTASVDRIDSNRGYTLDNIQIIHKRLNRMKCVLDNEEMIFWAHKIANKHEFTKEMDVSKIKFLKEDPKYPTLKAAKKHS